MSGNWLQWLSPSPAQPSPVCVSSEPDNHCPGWHCPVHQPAGPWCGQQSAVSSSHHTPRFTSSGVWCLVVACWNSHSGTRPWLAFQWRYAQIDWDITVVCVFCLQYSVITQTIIFTPSPHLTSPLGGTLPQCWNNFSSCYSNYVNTCGRSSTWISTICLKLMGNT